MKKNSGQLLYSPSDLLRYLASPFASWMDRYHLENPGAVTPDVPTEDQKLIAQTGDQHEREVLGEFKVDFPSMIEISKNNFAVARTQTVSAIIGSMLPSHAPNVWRSLWVIRA